MNRAVRDAEIRRLRRETNLTLEEVGAIFGITGARVSQIEHTDRASAGFTPLPGGKAEYRPCPTCGQPHHFRGVP